RRLYVVGDRTGQLITQRTAASDSRPAAGAAENGRVNASSAADLVRDRLGRVIFQRVAGPQGPERRRLINAPGERWFAEDRPVRRVHGDSSMFIGGAPPVRRAHA